MRRSISGRLVAVYGLVPVLAAKMTDYDRLLLLVLDIHVGRNWQFESGMHELAVGTIGTEASYVVGAQHSAHVSVSAMGAVAAKSTVIPASRD